LEGVLEAARQEYAGKHPACRLLFERASVVIPGGSTRAVLNMDPFPLRMASAKRAFITDVDGFEYLDLLGDFTAGLFGHDPGPVGEAVTATIARGWSFGAGHENEVRLAELITERFPSIEQVRFANSGSEATLLAVSLARHVTQRSKVMAFHGAYHGAFLYMGAAGEGLRAPFNYVLCQYNDLEEAERAFAAHGADLACVIVEPLMGAGGCIPAQPGFLEGLRSLCDRSGTLLVLDEVMTSRMAYGGAQERLGIRPDLTTLGKYMAGGMNSGAFGGSAEIMAAFDPSRGGELAHGGTFNNNVVSMAAGVAALEHVLTSSLLNDLFERGEHLRRDVQAIFAKSTLPLSVTGWGSMMNFHATKAEIRSPSDLADADQRWRDLLVFRLIDAGYYLAPRGFMALSVEVTDAHLGAFLSDLAEIVEDLEASLG
jgi:glutamate-1-semialdehyde 2,1-aminomutase